jgi:hypothetical protein
LYDSKILNIFWTGSKKPWKLAKSLKIFLSRTANATGEQKTILKSIRCPFSSLFEATSYDWYFSDYASESAKLWKIKISMLNKFFTFGFRAKSRIANDQCIGSHTQGTQKCFEIWP